MSRKRRTSQRAPAPAGRPAKRVPRPAPTPRAARRAPAEEPVADVAHERRIGKVAGAAALGSLACSIAAVPVAAGGTGSGRIDASGGDRQLLLDVYNAGSGQTAALVLRTVGLLLLIVVMWFCYQVIKGRRPETARWVPYVGALGVAGLALNTVLGFHEVKNLADTYIGSGPQTPERAKQLLDDSTLLRGVAANLGRLALNVLFGLWLAMVCLDMIRVGLLTRFLGYFGFAAAVTTAIGFPAGDALFFGWLGSVGILALGYWPGGRPPAWEEGRAIPADDEGPRPMRPQRGSV